MKLIIIKDINNLSFKNELKFVKVDSEGGYTVKSFPNANNLEKTIEYLTDGYSLAIEVDEIPDGMTYLEAFELIEIETSKYEIKAGVMHNKKKLIRKRNN